MWQWLTRDKWWKKATPMNDEGYRSWDDDHASSFWRKIARIKQTFLCSIMFQVSNGAKIKFWEENRLNQPLYSLYPEIYERSNQRYYTIQQIYNHGERCLTFQGILSYETQRQIENINRRLQDVTLSEQA
jgi:hypothetical protein